MEPTNHVKRSVKFEKNKVNLNVIPEDSIPANEPSKEPKPSLTDCQRYITTLILFYIMMAYGMISFAAGPTLVDFSYIFEAPLSTVSLFTCAMSSGYCMGAFVGFAYDYVNRQLIVIAFFAITGIVNCLMPFAPSIPVYLFFGWLSSFGDGTLDAAQNIWLMEMWQDHSNTILQLAHFLFGVGAILAPAIERPFLIGELNNIENHLGISSNNSSIFNNSINLFTSSVNPLNSTLNPMNMSFINDNLFAINPLAMGYANAMRSANPKFNSYNPFEQVNNTISNDTVLIVSAYDRRMHMIPPFFIIGGITLSSVFLLAVMYCYKPYQQPERDMNNDDQSPEDKKLFEDAPKWLQTTMIVLISFCLGFYVSVEYSHFDYIVTYTQYIPLRLSAADGAFLASSMFAVYTSFRFLSAFVALKLSPGQMLVIHYTLVLGSEIALLFGSTSITVLWVANMTLGAGFSAIFGGVFAFADQYMVLGNYAGTSLIAAAGSSALFTLFYVGKLIKEMPEVLIYFNIINSLISITFFIIINLIIKWWSKKTKKETKRAMNYQYSKRLSVCSMGAMGPTASYLSRRRSSAGGTRL